MREQRTIQLDTGDWPAENPRAEVDPAAETRARLVEALALQVRSIYCICYRELTGNADYGRKPMPYWDGGDMDESGYGTRKRSVWPKIAAVIIQHDADPLQYIRAQFIGVRRAEPPRPNTLYNEQALTRWRTYSYHAKERLRQQVASDWNQIRTNVLPFTVNLKWDERSALDYVLRDPKCGASSLARYCAAVAESLPIATAFRERALLQYMFQMANYDDLLGDMLPQELKDEARELKSLLVGQ